MKTMIATIAFAMSLSPVAWGQRSLVDTSSVGRGGCAGELLGTCEEYENGERVGPNYVTCMARDSAGRLFTYTGSYGRPTHENVEGAISACRRGSAHPSSCHWTACRWAD
jgi:hypothetical protein